ncbi:MAG: cell division initiation protein [Gaiellaceae bacterium]|jgi:cell division septum initiation protein DivIVA|nr:cell division initiation protein [Gaiellaceae bacterium]
MRYTPVELRHVKIGRSTFGGYRKLETEKLIEDIADSFEEVWRDRGELTDKLEDVEKILAEVKQRESLLASTLVAAEKASTEIREAAKREAELIIAEAHQEARSVTRGAQSERARLFTDVRRVETLLRAALGMVEETTNGLPASPAVPAAEPQPEHWPKRQDTREFQAVPLAQAEEQPKLPPVQSVPDETDDGPSAARDFAWG